MLSWREHSDVCECQDRIFPPLKKENIFKTSSFISCSYSMPDIFPHPLRGFLREFKQPRRPAPLLCGPPFPGLCPGRRLLRQLPGGRRLPHGRGVFGGRRRRGRPVALARPAQRAAHRAHLHQAPGAARAQDRGHLPGVLVQEEGQAGGRTGSTMYNALIMSMALTSPHLSPAFSCSSPGKSPASLSTTPIRCNFCAEERERELILHERIPPRVFLNHARKCTIYSTTCN